MAFELFRPYLDAVLPEVDDEGGALRDVVEECGAVDAGGGGNQSAFGGEEAQGRTVGEAVDGEDSALGSADDGSGGGRRVDAGGQFTFLVEITRTVCPADGNGSCI